MLGAAGHEAWALSAQLQNQLTCVPSSLTKTWESLYVSPVMTAKRGWQGLTFWLSWNCKWGGSRGRGLGWGFDSACVRVCLLQVALLVAAEFWEQGDLERTVLQQNPIVSR